MVAGIIQGPSRCCAEGVPEEEGGSEELRTNRMGCFVIYSTVLYM